MKKSLLLTALIALMVLTTGNAMADGRRHTHVGIGVSVGAPFWNPWPPPPVYYYPQPYYGPIIIERPAPPPVYIEQAAPPEPPPNYWYYCQSPSGYYPAVRECPSGWIKIPPRS